MDDEPMTIDDGRYARIPAWAIGAIPRLCGDGALKIYAAIRSFDRRGGECFPSNQAIAQVAGVSDRTVRRYVKALKGAGLLSVERRPPERGRGNRSNRYRFPVPPAFTRTTGVPVNGADAERIPGQNRPEYQDRSAPNTRTEGVPHNRAGTEQEQQRHAPADVIPHLAAMREAVARTGQKTASSSVDFVERATANDPATAKGVPAMAAIWSDLLRLAVEAHDAKPVRLALATLDAGILVGRRPADPLKLPAYFAPILERAIDAWTTEQAAQAQADAQAADREQRRAEYDAWRKSGPRPRRWAGSPAALRLAADVRAGNPPGLQEPPPGARPGPAPA